MTMTIRYAAPPPAIILAMKFLIIELKQSGGHSTSSGKPCSLRPAEPVIHQCLQSGKPFSSAHGRLNNMRLSELRHVLKQFDLNLFLRVEMSEQPALRHPDLI